MTKEEMQQRDEKDMSVPVNDIISQLYWLNRREDLTDRDAQGLILQMIRMCNRLTTAHDLDIKELLRLSEVYETDTITHFGEKELQVPYHVFNWVESDQD